MSKEFTATTSSHNRSDNLMLPQLRWDKANRELYYEYTGQCLQPMVAVVDEMLLTYKTGQAMADRALNPAIGLLCQFLCFFCVKLCCQYI